MAISESRQAEAVRLYRDGLNAADIAKLIRTDKATVLRCLRLAGVTRPRLVERRRASA